MFRRKFDKSPSDRGDPKYKVVAWVGVGLMSRNRGVLVWLGERSQWEAESREPERALDGCQDIHVSLRRLEALEALETKII